MCFNRRGANTFTVTLCDLVSLTHAISFGCVIHQSIFHFAQMVLHCSRSCENCDTCERVKAKVKDQAPIQST
jgi:hypothetical protein